VVSVLVLPADVRHVKRSKHSAISMLDLIHDESWHTSQPLSRNDSNISYKGFCRF